MSEFTSCNLILAEDRKFVENSLYDDSIIKSLDYKWSIYLTKDFYMEGEAIPKHILQISERCPIFYFFNYSDHFWGYRVLHKSMEIAKFRISYEFDEELIFEYAKERYPDKDIMDLYEEGIYDELKKEINDNNLLEKELRNIFDSSNIEMFKLFKLSDLQINSLKNIISFEYFSKLDNKWNLVEEFKKVLGISEISYISYESVLDE